MRPDDIGAARVVGPDARQGAGVDRADIVAGAQELALCMDRGLDYGRAGSVGMGCMGRRLWAVWVSCLGRLPEPLAEPPARFAVERQTAEHIDFVGGEARVGTAVQEDRDRLGPVCCRREEERRLAGGRLARVGVGTVLQQSGHGRRAPHGSGRQVERGCAAVGRLGARVGAGVQQEGHRVVVAAAGGEVQGRVAPDPRSGVHRCPGVEQRADRSGVSVFSRQVECGDPVAPRRARVRSRPQQGPDRLRVAKPGSLQQIVAELQPLGCGQLGQLGQRRRIDPLDRRSVRDAERHLQHARQGGPDQQPAAHAPETSPPP